MKNPFRNLFVWDEWRGDDDGRIVMLVKTLLDIRGFRIQLHQFVAADALQCFHTHPSAALRIILKNGYMEELEDGTMHEWKAGMFGIVWPTTCHRVHKILSRTGRDVWTLWIRLPKKHEIELRGAGWKKEMTVGLITFELEEI